MFMIKDTSYNIEYEGLHLLCTRCGRFGHYKEGCPEKEKVVGGHVGGDSRGETAGKTSGISGNEAEGPWRVVQKYRKNRKATLTRNNLTTDLNEAPAKINVAAKSTGSRFDMLGEDDPEMNMERLDREEDLEVQILEGSNERQESQRGFANKGKHIKNRRVNGGTASKSLDGSSKDTKLAPRGGGNFKGRHVLNIKKGVENVVDKMGIQTMAAQVQKPDLSHYNDKNSENDVDRVGEMEMDLNKVVIPNKSRPPNESRVHPPILEPASTHGKEDTGLEGEEFQDANDQGIHGSLDSDMELVEETPDLAK
jgi:hypothetical protein